MDAPVAISPDDVLAQPTRARLFALLGELRRPAGTVELAERLGLHPNGVRIHLERMAQAGLVERAQVRHQRGRPPDAWTIAADAQPGGSPPRAYQDLGRWLARALRGRSRGLRSIEETGRQIGRELAPEGVDVYVLPPSLPAETPVFGPAAFVLDAQRGSVGIGLQGVPPMLHDQLRVT